MATPARHRARGRAILSERPLASRRAWAKASAWLLNTLIAAGLLALLVDRFVPPQHLPWTALSLDQPPGLFTAAKLDRVGGDPRRCRRFLDANAIRFTEASTRTEGFCTTENSVRLSSGVTALSPAGPITACPLALQYALWDRQVVRPAARELLGSGIRRIEHFGAYSCRRVYGRATGSPSNHARAAALDVAAFVTRDGRRVSVLDDWEGEDAEAAFLRRVRDGACRVFSGVLSPDYNAAHADHLHLDDGRWRTCR